MRREVALAMRGMPFDQSRDILLTLAAGYDGTDRWYLEALGTGGDGNEARSTRRCSRPCPHRDPLNWDRRFAAIAWRLHPVAAVDAFAARAAASQLPAEARQQALVALGFINDPARRPGDGRPHAQPASATSRRRPRGG